MELVTYIALLILLAFKFIYFRCCCSLKLSSWKLSIFQVTDSQQFRTMCSAPYFAVVTHLFVFESSNVDGFG